MSLLSILTVGGSKEAIAAFLYANINSNATTIVKSQKALLYQVTINKAGTNWLAYVIDGVASGSSVATVDGTAVGGYGYNCLLDNGLTLITSGSAAGDLTVVYL